MKTRFAPSPTGFIHLGNARTALFSALLAQANQGKFLLRIEDTDQTRSKQCYVDQLKIDLQWLGIDWQEGVDQGGQEGPYFQSQRSDIYQKYYQQLEKQGHAYHCFCSEQELAIQRKTLLRAGKPPRYSGKCRALTVEQRTQKIAQGLKPVLRFAMPKDQWIEFDDLVKGKQRFRSSDIGDFIIRRADGSAAFMYCNAVDDSLMAVSLVLRGEDHLTNTPRQLAILMALALPTPHYGHIALITGQDRAPLSKRNGSRSIQEMRQSGYLPQAVVNYMARLGHSYKENKLYSFQELVDNFGSKNLSSAPACYDEKQLNYWQKQSVLTLNEQQLAEWLTGIEVPEDKKNIFFQVVKDNCSFNTEAKEMANIFFSTSPFTLNEEAQATICQAGRSFFVTALAIVEQHSVVTFSAMKSYLESELGIKGKALFKPLRLALTGLCHGVDMSTLFELLSHDQLQQRLQAALSLTSQDHHEPA